MPKVRRGGKVIYIKKANDSAYQQQPRSMYTEDDLDAVTWYTGSGYEINTDLAENPEWIDDTDWAMIKNLDNAINKTKIGDSDTNPQLYRGVGAWGLGVDNDIQNKLAYMGKEEAVKFINENLVGTEFVNKGFTSVSLSAQKAFDFGRYILRFQGIRDDIRGMAVSGQQTKDRAFSTFGRDEHEIILQRGFAYMITGAEYYNGYLFVDVLGY